MICLRLVKIIYGDGSAESYLSPATYNEVLEQAREVARARGTFVRGFTFRLS
ncbi:hypothetical protein [Marasmitruncus massiliensis]|uniref:hypothetical protein n=1 Tax=Marasmitruncus massiliensis TaxID=1944642 RepID=UPI0015E13DC9|nr:hypothetical protein [Marasmitruncus massiliensis]